MSINPNDHKKQQKLKKLLYQKIFHIRAVEEFLSKNYSQEIFRCPIHLSIGQEAVAVGVCENLEDTDLVFSSHRCHAHYFAKGGDTRTFFAELLGKKTGCSKGQGGSQHLVAKDVGFMGSTSIVAGTIPVAVGTALASKILNKKQISVAFFGDAASEEGVFWESLNYASLKKLPVLFCMENNGYACYTKLAERQPARDMKQLCDSLNIGYTYFESGWDVFTIQEKVSVIIKDLRKNPRPYFIESNVLRRYEHCGPNKDDHLNYRTKNELTFWNQDETTKDPIVFAGHQLQDCSMIEKEIHENIQKAFALALKDPNPDHKDIGRFLYEQ